MGPAQSRRGGAREDGQAGRLGRSPSRLEEMRWQTQGGGAGRHGDVGTQMREQRERGQQWNDREMGGGTPWFQNEAFKSWGDTGEPPFQRPRLFHME